MQLIHMYLGQSIDVRDRIQNHKYGAQKVDEFIKRNLKRNGGKDLRVKWVRDPNHKSNEEAYLRCVEQMLGYKLKYNVIRGNSRN